MGFQNAQPDTEKTDQAAQSTQPVQRSTLDEKSTFQPSMMGQTWPTIERAEEHFGIQIPDESTLQQLEDHEHAYGRETHEWIAEGMPAEIMGSPREMDAFRQRQSERPPEVPTDIERQNRRSVLRSEKAAGESSLAGETGVPDPVRDVISSSGRSLDGSIQRAMEDRMVIRSVTCGFIRVLRPPKPASRSMRGRSRSAITLRSTLASTIRRVRRASTFWLTNLRTYGNRQRVW